LPPLLLVLLCASSSALLQVKYGQDGNRVLIVSVA
jgi:hypothetical protein